MISYRHRGTMNYVGTETDVTQTDIYSKEILGTLVIRSVLLQAEMIFFLCDFLFDVLLTVHYSNDQFWFQLMHHNFTLSTGSPSQTYQPYSRHKR